VTFAKQSTMRVYQGKSMRGDNVDHEAFVRLFGAAIVERSEEPFLLVRDDDSRVQVVTSDGNLMLCLARGPNDCQVSYGSSYVDAPRQFCGLSGMCEAREENFVDASFAMQAVHAFFNKRRMSEFVDFRRGCPDSEIMAFPKPIRGEERVERKLIEKRIEVPVELRTDMQSVCEFLDEVAEDPDENIDFDDAIQIGSLCGGRSDALKDQYIFSYHLDSGDVWQFEVPRTILEGIADGSISRLRVMASVPK
jgi:hypothetical protein